MLARPVRFALTVLAGAFILSGCGQDKSDSAVKNSGMADLAFEGAFASTAIECVGRSGVRPVDRAGEVRRSMLIVNDHVLVTDQNSVELITGKPRGAGAGLGMVDVVSRYYEAENRSPSDLGGGGMRIELRQPAEGHVSKMATSFENREIPEGRFHPITAALRKAEKQIWIYAAKGTQLQVYFYHPDGSEYAPDGWREICGGNPSNLRVTFERKFR